MASLNKICLIGNLGRDPEVKYLPNGDAVVNTSIATNEKWKDKGGDSHEETTWFNLTLFRRLAEIADEYLKKGDQIYVEGKMKMREYEKDGITRQAWNVHVSELKMLGSKHARDDESNDDEKPAKPAPKTPKQGTIPETFEDDIPF